MISSYALHALNTRAITLLQSNTILEIILALVSWTMPSSSDTVLNSLFYTTMAASKHHVLHVNIFRGVVVLVCLRHFALYFFFQGITPAPRGPGNKTILLSKSEASHVNAADIWCCPGIIAADRAGSFRPSRHAGPKVSGVDFWTDSTDSLDVSTLEACRQGYWKHRPVKDRTLWRFKSVCGFSRSDRTRCVAYRLFRSTTTRPLYVM